MILQTRKRKLKLFYIFHINVGLCIIDHFTTGFCSFKKHIIVFKILNVKLSILPCKIQTDLILCLFLFVNMDLIFVILDNIRTFHIL